MIPDLGIIEGYFGKAWSWRARYSACASPVAKEIVDWLDGGYAITGEILQTQ